MTDVTVTAEFEYCYLDTREWFAAVAEDVSDHWQEIVARIRDHCPHTDHYHYEHSGGADRCARDRIIAALGKRCDPFYGHADTYADHTSNRDSNFYDDFGFAAVDLYRGGINYGVLIFVSMGDYHDTGLDHVYHVDSWDEAYQTLSPTIGYYCQTCKDWGDTTTGGYAFETGDGETRKDVIADGHATCSNGHAVTLTARDSF